MMEKSQRRVSENDSVLVRGLDALLVHDAPRRRGEIPNTALPRAVHVIWEREEGVARARHAVKPSRVFRALLGAERGRDLPEQALPLRLLAALEHVAPDEEVDRVCLFGALDALLEWQREHARVVPQPPVVCFGPREPRAVDARLLACAQSDD